MEGISVRGILWEWRTKNCFLSDICV